MKRVLVISTSQDDKKQLQEVVKAHEPGAFEFEVTASFGQDAEYWKARPPAVLVIQLPDDQMLQPYFVEKIKKDIPRFLPVIILCPQISQLLMQLSFSHSKLRFYKTPVNPYAIYRALLDLTKVYKEGERQIHPRYQTEQAVEITSDFVEGRMPAIMRNLSLTGAYFETESNSLNSQPEDLVKINIYLGESEKQYIFDVKIVWLKKQENGSLGFGVSFVNKEEVYNSLLKNL